MKKEYIEPSVKCTVLDTDSGFLTESPGGVLPNTATAPTDVKPSDTPYSGTFSGKDNDSFEWDE